MSRDGKLFLDWTLENFLFSFRKIVLGGFCLRSSIPSFVKKNLLNFREIIRGDFLLRLVLNCFGIEKFLDLKRCEFFLLLKKLNSFRKIGWVSELKSIEFQTSQNTCCNTVSKNFSCWAMFLKCFLFKHSMFLNLLLINVSTFTRSVMNREQFKWSLKNVIINALVLASCSSLRHDETYIVDFWRIFLKN